MTIDQLFYYQLYAQNRDNQLVIKNMSQNNYFTISAKNLLNNPKLLQHFTPEEIEIIKFIAETEATNQDT
jgi:hypothetical protein